MPQDKKISIKLKEPTTVNSIQPVNNKTTNKEKTVNTKDKKTGNKKQRR